MFPKLGEYEIKVTIDPENKIVEENEKDNKATLKVKVK